MKWRIIGAISLVIVLAFGCCSNVVVAHDMRLTEQQEEIAEKIYSVVSIHYDEYGVLPSTCMAQAFEESTLGEYAPARKTNNLWGIQNSDESGRSYASLEEGIIAYLEVINNGHYDSALFETDTLTQIREILDGGYCTPEGNYYNDVAWILQHYDLKKYDERMWRERREAEEERQRQAEALEVQRQQEELIALLQAQEAEKQAEDNKIVEVNDNIVTRESSFSVAKNTRIKGSSLVTSYSRREDDNKYNGRNTQKPTAGITRELQ